MATARQTKASAGKPPSRAALSRLLDQLGAAREELAKAQAAEKDLAARMRAGLEAAGLDSHQTRTWAAQLAQRTSLTIDPARLAKRLDLAAMLAVVRVDASRARGAGIDEAILAACGEMSTSTYLRISRRG